MKIHLGINEYIMNGYTNIDPAGGEGKIVGDIRNLDAWCEAASCLEIYAPNALDFIHGSQLIEVLRNWISKLRHGGKIIVGGLDIYEVAKGIVSKQLTVADGNQLLFNNFNVVPFIKLGAYTWTDIETVLVQLGLKVTCKRTNNRKFVLEAQRD